jgi:hypothetical protein
MYPMNVFDDEMELAEQVEIDLVLLYMQAGLTLAQIRAFEKEMERGKVN